MVLAANTTLKTTPLMERPAWKALEDHYQKIRNVHLRSLFADDPRRGENLTAEGAGLYLDSMTVRPTHLSSAIANSKEADPKSWIQPGIFHSAFRISAMSKVGQGGERWPRK